MTIFLTFMFFKNIFYNNNKNPNKRNEKNMLLIKYNNSLFAKCYCKFILHSKSLYCQYGYYSFSSLDPYAKNRNDNTIISE